MNTKRLARLSTGVLDDVRKNLGWQKGEATAEVDARINEMTPLQVARRWSTWHLGYADWADDIINIYKRLSRKSPRRKSLG